MVGLLKTLNDMICHSAIEQRPLVEWPAFFAGRIETQGRCGDTL
jgi:hypothetical protein